MSPTGEERRHRHLQRALMWLLAPFVDHWRGLSLTRFIAITLTVTAVHGPLVHEHAIGPMDVTMATLAVVTALGGKYVLAFLTREPAKP